MRTKDRIAPMVVALVVALAIAGTGLAITALVKAPHPIATAAVGACGTGTTVQTEYGPVCGTSATSYNQWQGIPYAAPPVGDLRWEPPQQFGGGTILSFQEAGDSELTTASAIAADHHCGFWDRVTSEAIRTIAR